MTNLAPFNLEKALAGEPVRLRNGQKAYILKQLQEGQGPGQGSYPLIGYSVDSNDCFYEYMSWTLEGKFSTSLRYGEDIVGMYKEEFKTCMPKPVPKIFAGNTYYYANMNKNKVSIRTPMVDAELDLNKDPILFETEAEAQQVLDAFRSNFKQ